MENISKILFLFSNRFFIYINVIHHLIWYIEAFDKLKILIIIIVVAMNCGVYRKCFDITIGGIAI